MNAPLIAPTDVATIVPGTMPRSTSARSMPTWMAPRLAPPESTNVTGVDVAVMPIWWRRAGISYVVDVGKNGGAPVAHYSNANDRRATMSLDGHADPSAATLVVADWAVDPEAVAATCAARDRGPALHLVVPAWLHGLDWTGDPFASVPCARSQLERIVDLCRTAGLRVASAKVGDPDPLSAIGDALEAARVDEIVLFARGRHVNPGHPFSVVRRAERLSGLRVTPVAVRAAPRPPRRRFLAGSHCVPATHAPG